MPAHAEDYTHAREEGAAFVWLASPVEFLGDEGGRVRAVLYDRMTLCEPDASGRCRPVPIPGARFTVETDTVVLALGYCPDDTLSNQIPGLRLDRRGKIAVRSEQTGETSVPGIFAAGDAVRGADLVAPAIANACTVAETLHAYLQT